MQKRQRIGLLMLVGTVAWVCAGGQEEDTDAVARVRITTHADMAAALQSHADTFMAAHPAVAIELDIAGDAVQFKETAPQIFASADSPDVSTYFTGPQSGYPVLLRAGELLALNGVYADQALGDAIDPAILDSYRSFDSNDRSFYAAPIAGVFFPVIYYNRAIFAEVGIEAPEGGYTTVEAFYNMSDRLRAAGYEPLTAGLLEGWIIGHVNDAIFQRTVPPPIVEELKVSWLVGAEPDAAFTDPAVIASYEVFAEFIERVFAEGSMSRSYAEGRSLFIQERAAMYSDGSWGSNSIRAESEIDFGWFLYPQFDPAIEPRMLAFYGDAILIPRRTSQPEVALQFVAHVMSIERQLAAAADFGFIPSRSDIDPALIETALKYPVSSMWQAAKRYGTVTSIGNELSAQLSSRSFSLLQDLVVGRVGAAEVGAELERIAERLRSDR